jgi:hypothetical protein
MDPVEVFGEFNPHQIDRRNLVRTMFNYEDVRAGSRKDRYLR